MLTRLWPVAAIALASPALAAGYPIDLIQLIPSPHPNESAQALTLSSDSLLQEVSSYFDGAKYRKIKAQMIYSQTGQPDHLLLYLLIPGLHKMELAYAPLSPSMKILSVIHTQSIQTPENQKYQCPDDSIEFIAFAPNDNPLELQVTAEVAQAARDHGLKTVELLKDQATREQYLNYLMCPHLKGNFYDGDSNPEAITTFDGAISSKEFKTILEDKFRHKVTNIWLACEAYNDPIRSVIRDHNQSQKYAAGINDLTVGPSDHAAACAMIAAIEGKPMTLAFQDCVQQLDIPEDHWGFGGDGSDYFGH